MEKEYRKLLIVDDSEIDREVLKSILSDDFDIVEVENGYSAFEMILQMTGQLDAILLDVSMPVLDGFSLLKLMKERGIDNIPVFLITSEATKNNVERAAQYNICEFIKKPFDREEVLRRLMLTLGIISRYNLTEAALTETNRYISDLEALYKKYLANAKKDSAHYARMTDLMKILLNKYSMNMKGMGLDKTQIEIISKAAYFCDIGSMMVPLSNRKFSTVKKDEAENDIYQNHTVLGADLIRLNYSKNCEYFVHICAEMCEKHHERYDGNGFPNRISGNNNAVYTQVCRLVDEFDSLFFKYSEHNEVQFDFVVNDLSKDKGAVSQEVFSLLTDSKFSIIMYYTMGIV